MLFTIITEKAGSTRVEQLEAPDAGALYLLWNTASQDPPRMNPVRLGIGSPTPVGQLQGVWRLCGRDEHDVFFISHVVATVAGDKPQG